jgi:CheY-like chemotaxis protein
MRILVVDDDVALREIVCEVLESAGYQAAPAADGEEALAALCDSERADVVLLDLMMPRMSGYELREKLLETPSLAEIPVVLMTASRGVDTSTLAPLAGVLLKPVDVNQLLDAVSKARPA